MVDVSRDPRSRHAKRSASRSPDGSAAQKRPSSFSRPTSANLPGNDSSSQTSGQAPVAPMSPMRNGGEHNEVSALAVVTSFFDIAAENADLRRQRREAESRLDQATREYEGTKMHFSSFPAIKEQKTQAKERAREQLNRINKQSQNRAPQVKQVLDTLASILSRTAEIEHSKLLDSEVHTEISHLKAEVDQLKKAVEKITGTDLTDIRSAIVEHSDKSKATAGSVSSSRLASFEQKLDDYGKTHEVLVQALAKHEISCKAETEAKVEHMISAQRIALESSLAKMKEAHDELKQALNDSVERTAKLEASERPKNDLEVSELREKLSSIQSRIEKVEDTAATAPVPGLLPFQPVIPTTIEEDVPQTHAQALSTLRSEVEMLKGVTGQHTRRMDNLTTDEVVRQMLDEMGKMYPDANNVQTTCTFLRNELDITKNQLTQMRSTTATLSASYPADVGKLRTELETLTQRVAQHDEAVGFGKTQIVEVAGNVKALQEDAIRLHDAIAKLSGSKSST